MILSCHYCFLLLQIFCLNTHRQPYLIQYPFYLLLIHYLCMQMTGKNHTLFHMSNNHPDTENSISPLYQNHCRTAKNR